MYSNILEKLAAEAAAFNETVPAQQQEQQQQQQQQAPQGQQQQAPQGQDVAAMPQGQGQEQEQASPGVAAAQEMLAPIMDAAMQGDPNAQTIIAKTTGIMAAEIEAKAQEQMGGGQQAPTQAPMQPQSPEEAAANGMIPAQQPVPQAPQQGQPM